MITAERKPLAEIVDSIDSCRRILLVGCNECVTVCAAGGRKEVATLASALQMDFMKRGKTLDIREMTLERQCDPEYVEQLAPFIDQVDAVVSMACGCGVQEVVRRFKNKRVYPAVNTQVHGGGRTSGGLGRTMPWLRQLPAGAHWWYLSHCTMFQAVDEWALWRVDPRQMRNQQGRRLCLATDLGSAQGIGYRRQIRRHCFGKRLEHGTGRRTSQDC